MRRAAAAAALAAAVLGGCGHAGAPPKAGNLAVQRATLGPGLIGLTIRNDTRAPACLAQVAVDNGWVAFDGPARTVAPHASARLTIRYPWVAGEGYDVKVLTSSGTTLSYRIASHSAE